MALIVVPARNEARNLSFVVAELRRAAPGHEIVVVDDASDDETPELLAELGVSSIRMSVPLGVGSALRAGLRWGVMQGFEQVVRCDGDGQHRAEDVERLLAGLDDGADVVLGSRYLERSRATSGDGADLGPDRDYRPPLTRRMAQRLLAAVLSIWTGGAVTDTTSGYWAFGPRALRLLARHHPTGYPEPELLLFLRRHGLVLREVGVSMRRRRSGRTSLTPWRELSAVARVLLALVIVPLRKVEAEP